MVFIPLYNDENLGSSSRVPAHPSTTRCRTTEKNNKEYHGWLERGFTLQCLHWSFFRHLFYIFILFLCEPRCFHLGWLRNNKKKDVSTWTEEPAHPKSQLAFFRSSYLFSNSTTFLIIKHFLCSEIGYHQIYLIQLAHLSRIYMGYCMSSFWL